MSITNTAQFLHERFNPGDEWVPPVRVKGYTRTELAKLFAELGFQHGAEVGVAEGRYSKVLCEHIPGLKLRCVDLWGPYEKKGAADQDKAWELAHQALQPYTVEFMRGPSVQMAEAVPDGSLDFVYIDADHRFDFVMQDLIVWSRKVRKGGIVAGHDYYRFRGAGVVLAVETFVQAHRIHEWFLDDQRETSFFWAHEWN